MKYGQREMFCFTFPLCYVLLGMSTGSGGEGTNFPYPFVIFYVYFCLFFVFVKII